MNKPIKEVKEIIYYCEQGNPYCIYPKCLCNTINPKINETKNAKQD